MSKQTRIVKVPKPSPQSFNMHRSLEKNALLMTQVTHFKEVEKDLPPDKHTGIALHEIRTEAQAAEYIKRMTSRLHAQAPKRPLAPKKEDA